MVTALCGMVGAALGIVVVVGFLVPRGVLVTGGCGPVLVRSAGFDPWTGEPHGQITQVNCLGSTLVNEDPVPGPYAGQTGIPWASVATIGFAMAGLVVGWVLSRLPRAPSHVLT